MKVVVLFICFVMVEASCVDGGEEGGGSTLGEAGNRKGRGVRSWIIPASRVAENRDRQSSSSPRVRIRDSSGYEDDAILYEDQIDSQNDDTDDQQYDYYVEGEEESEKVVRPTLRPTRRPPNGRPPPNIQISTSESFPTTSTVAPNILNTIDGAFTGLKDYDKYSCVQKVICEVMHHNGDDISKVVNRPADLVDDTFNTLTDRIVSSNQQKSTRSGIRHERPTRVDAGQIFRSPSPHHQQINFQDGPPRVYVPLNQASHYPAIQQQLLSRQKRQTSSLHTKMKLLSQIMGWDKRSFFPFLEAALIGHSSTRNKRVRFNRNSCSRRYTRCPTTTREVTDFINNYNGGLANTLTQQFGETGPAIPLVALMAADYFTVDEKVHKLSDTIDKVNKLPTKLRDASTADENDPNDGTFVQFLTNYVSHGIKDDRRRGTTRDSSINRYGQPPASTQPDWATWIAKSFQKLFKNTEDGKDK